MATPRFFDGAQKEIGSLPIEDIPVAASSFWVRISGVWKQCVTWIKVLGVWKQATPKTKNGGTWTA
jgi:hypothetical protein